MRTAYFDRPLTMSEIAEHAPSVVNKKVPAHVLKNLTQKYSFIPTVSLMKDLKELGWIPYLVEQRQVQRGNEDRMQFTKHMVVFRNPDIDVHEGVIPEIILTNSHDGRNSFRFYLGVYDEQKRISFVVFSDKLEDYKIKHQGIEPETVDRVVQIVLQMVPKVYMEVKRMNKVILNEDDKQNFARKAIKLRWPRGKKEVHVADLLAPMRKHEQEDTLWNVLTTLQEKLVNGGITYRVMSKQKRVFRHQTARALENIDQKIEIKKDLWYIATQLA